MKHKGRTWRKRQKRSSCDKPISLANKPDYILLFKWAKRNGITFHKMRPCLFPDIGRGLLSTGQIYVRDTLISVPKNMLITATMVRQDYLIKTQPDLDINTVNLLCLFLIIEQSLGTSSFWFPYINMLPKEFDTPSYFSQKEAGILPPFLHEQWQSQVKEIRRCQKHLKELLGCVSIKGTRDNILLTFETVQWAWSVVNTRCVFMDWDKHLDKGMSCALAPLLDLLNHSSEVEVQAGFSHQSHHYNLHTNTRFSKGNQVFINYGPHNNRKLLIEYGFILPNNCQNSIKIETSDIYPIISRSSSGCSDYKYNIIQKYKLEDAYSCTATGLSWSLNTAFKILVLDETRVLDKSLNIEDLALTSEERERFLMFSRIILTSLLEKYNFYLKKLKAFSTKTDLKSSPDRMNLVRELLTQENEMLINAWAILE